jgi:hypothetical protein
MLRWCPEEKKSTTMFPATRGTYGDHGGLDLFQGRKRGMARDARGDDELRVHDAVLDLLQNKMNRGREKVCQVKAEGMGERGRSRAHGRRWIRADALADMADSGERFRQLGGAIGSGARG